MDRQNLTALEEERQNPSADIFLTMSKDTGLGSKALCQIARMTGFCEDDESWEEEWEMLCEEYGVSPKDGFNLSSFTAFIAKENVIHQVVIGYVSPGESVAPKKRRKNNRSSNKYADSRHHDDLDDEGWSKSRMCSAGCGRPASGMDLDTKCLYPSCC